MKKIMLLIVLASLCLNFTTKAQEKTSITALKIGDTVPDITISNIINYKDAAGKPATSAKISDFKGKLLILDFWATWCSGCIQYFPKLESLQNQFGSKLQILGVAYEDEKKINHFFKSKSGPDGNRYTVTSVVNDTIFGKLFPHRLIPHCIIIGPDNKVIAITSTEYINADNIEKLLDKQGVDFTIKKDIDADIPLLMANDAPIKDIDQYSMLLKGHFSGLGSGTRFRVSNGITRGRAVTNAVLLIIYEAAVRQLFDANKDFYSDKRLILDVKDASKIIMTKSVDGLWETKNHYTYDFIVPLSASDSLYQYMLQDLNRYTAYYGKIEKRKVKCWILTRTSKIDKLKSSGGYQENSLFYKTPAKLINYPIKYLITRINEEDVIKYPVIDETHYSGNIDISFSNFTDIPSLRHELQRYDLDLIEAYRDLDMFVLHDKAANSNPRL